MRLYKYLLSLSSLIISILILSAVIIYQKLFIINNYNYGKVDITESVIRKCPVCNEQMCIYTSSKDLCSFKHSDANSMDKIIFLSSINYDNYGLSCPKCKICYSPQKNIWIQRTADSSKFKPELPVLLTSILPEFKENRIFYRSISENKIIYECVFINKIIDINFNLDFLKRMLNINNVKILSENQLNNGAIELLINYNTNKAKVKLAEDENGKSILIFYEKEYNTK